MPRDTGKDKEEIGVENPVEGLRQLVNRLQRVIDLIGKEVEELDKKNLTEKVGPYSWVIKK